MVYTNKKIFNFYLQKVNIFAIFDSMKVITFLYKNSSASQSILIEGDTDANHVYNDMLNSIMNRKSSMMISLPGGMKMITPKLIIDLTICDQENMKE